MPTGIEVLSLSYGYPRRPESGTPLERGSYTAQPEVNVIDLGLIAPDGTQVGASGSDKNEIFVSSTRATPGYKPCALVPGEWQILVGAYKVGPGGVEVSYELKFTPKHVRLLKGDLHTHTVASDGVLTVEELAAHARRQGLDFLAITDHNQPVCADSLPRLEGMTLIPGIEWTHYLGHANFLGVDRPYDEPFYTNSVEEMQARFTSAHQRGALITINHPFEQGVEFRFDLNSIPYDCLEIWNGPMRESNLRAVGLWQSLLASGKKVPICAGSDYHRDTPFIFPGGPTTCVYAYSASPEDILDALRKGHAFLTFAPNGPELEVTAGTAMQGDSVRFSTIQSVDIAARGLLAGDVVQVITAQGRTTIVKAEHPGRLQTSFVMPAPGFARAEILRSFIPGLPLLPAAISNPVYFDAD